MTCGIADGTVGMGTVVAIGGGNTMETGWWEHERHTTSMTTTDSSRVAEEAFLSVEVECALFDLIVTLGSVAPISTRVATLQVLILGGKIWYLKSKKICIREG